VHTRWFAHLGAFLVFREEEARTNSELPELPVILFDLFVLRNSMNKSLLLASLIAAAALTACGKTEAPAAPAAPAPVAAPASEAAPVAAPASEAAPAASEAASK